MSVKVTDKMPEFIDKNTQVCEVVLTNMRRDMVNLIKIRQPYEGGEMMRQTYGEKTGPLKHRVIINVEYASYQNRGMRYDGTRIVKNYTTPGTGKQFVEDAAENIYSHGPEYFKQAFNTIRLGL